MKKFLCAAMLVGGVSLAHSARAEHWAAPVNGTVSTIMMPDGSIQMKVKMPAAEMAAMTEMMHAGKSCMIEHIYPDALNTMILVCR